MSGSCQVLSTASSLERLHKKFVKGNVDVWVRGLVNGKWTKATIMTVRLESKAAPRGPTSPPKSTPHEMYLREWAGWSSASQHYQKETTLVKASWIVPRIDCGGWLKKAPRAAMWVGLWGPLDKDDWLAQIGTNSQCEFGSPRYLWGVSNVPRRRWDASYVDK